MKWIKEIKAVGFLDWCWFVFWIRRREFHPKLSDITQRGVFEARQRAHRIDEILSDLDGWKKAVTKLHANKVNRRFLS